MQLTIRMSLLHVLGLLTLMGLLGSCSMNRAFISEMDRPTDGFFVADRDFPVSNGDSGKAYRDKKEIRLRTPASGKNAEKYAHQNALEEELDRLEGSQTDQAFQHYLRYRDQFSTLSEKIYFLRLRNLRDRDNYLYGKGFMDGSGPSPQEHEAIRNHDILLGMSKEAVISSWGRPARVDVAGKSSYENERWAFHRRGRLQYVYFEGGVVQGWSQ